MNTLRFNLGKGERYMKWKLTRSDGTIQYLDPDHYVILMYYIRLRNRRSTADKIFKGANKTVCAWVEARNVKVISKEDSRWKESERHLVSYNPRVAPHWRNHEGENIDNHSFSFGSTDGKQVFVILPLILEE